MTDDWDKLLDNVSKIAEAKGAPKQEMLKYFRRALRVVDKATSVSYASGYYKWDNVRFDGRETGLYRAFIKRASAFRYQWKKTKKHGWKYRSMIRRNQETGYIGNLSHLVEDGAYNKRFNKYTIPKGYRRDACNRTRGVAEREAIKGIKEALKKA